MKLALALFDETTIAATETYFSENKSQATFLKLIGDWWNVVNSKERFHPNMTGNALDLESGKINFLRQMAD